MLCSAYRLHVSCSTCLLIRETHANQLPVSPHTDTHTDTKRHQGGGDAPNAVVVAGAHGGLELLQNDLGHKGLRQLVHIQHYPSIHARAKTERSAPPLSASPPFPPCPALALLPPRTDIRYSFQAAKKPMVLEALRTLRARFSSRRFTLPYKHCGHAGDENTPPSFGQCASTPQRKQRNTSSDYATSTSSQQQQTVRTGIRKRPSGTRC